MRSGRKEYCAISGFMSGMGDFNERDTVVFVATNLNQISGHGTSLPRIQPKRSDLAQCFCLRLSLLGRVTYLVRLLLLLPGSPLHLLHNLLGPYLCLARADTSIISCRTSVLEDPASLFGLRVHVRSARVKAMNA